MLTPSRSQLFTFRAKIVTPEKTIKRWVLSATDMAKAMELAGDWGFVFNIAFEKINDAVTCRQQMMSMEILRNLQERYGEHGQLARVIEMFETASNTENKSDSQEQSPSWLCKCITQGQFKILNEDMIGYGRTIEEAIGTLPIDYFPFSVHLLNQTLAMQLMEDSLFQNSAPRIIDITK